MKIINPPLLLLNSVYVKGLRQPLEACAEVLEDQDRPDIGLALRYAAQVCDMYAEVLLDKTAQLTLLMTTPKGWDKVETSNEETS